MRRGRRLLHVAALGAVCASVALTLTAGARSSERSAAWAWSVPLPGSPMPGDSSLRQLAAAGDLDLLAAPRDGHVAVGTAAVDLRPLPQDFGSASLVVYAAATAAGQSQELVGVSRSDVDRVVAIRADGTETELWLNQWRGFSYTAATPASAAVAVQAYRGDTPVGALQVPQTTATASGASPATRSVESSSSPPAYRIGNPGRRITVHRRIWPGTTVPYKLYLLGTIAGRALYRLQLTPHYRCYGAGDAHKIGVVGTVSCPTVVGAYPIQLDDAAVSIPSKAGTVRYLRRDGVVADGAVKVELRDGSGNTVASASVINNLFAFKRPYPTGPERLVAVDAQGGVLPPRPNWGQHQQPPPSLFGPRAIRVPPARLQKAFQYGEAEGVSVSVTADGVVRVQLATMDAAARQRLQGHDLGVSCFVVSPTIRDTRSAGISLRWDSQSQTTFKILGYIKPPFDGCELSGSYGHRWHDKWGTHSPVEVRLTPRGQRFFDNRAAARDLALFVRSRQMQQIRKQHGAAFLAAIRRHYGSQVDILSSPAATAPAETLGIWAGGTRTIISERSSAGGRFYVEIDNGKLTKENVRGLAYVF